MRTVQSWPLIAIACAAAAVSISFAPSSQADNEPDPAANAEFQEIGRVQYGEGLGGIGSSRWTSGFTLATLPPDKNGFPQFVLSMAFDKTETDYAGLRVIALDKAKNEFSMRQAEVSGAGSKHRVVTFLCTIPRKQPEISELVVQKLLRR